MASGDEASEQASSSCGVFHVVPIPGKGHGCRAMRDIEKGERIVAEAPLLMQGPGQPPLNAAVESLSPAGRQQFYALTQNQLRFGVTPTARGIFATNAHPCHDFNLLYRGIFPVIARMNHACDASACYRWNANLQKLTVHAARRITAGEEITVCCERTPSIAYAQPLISTADACAHSHASTDSFDGLLREQRQRHLRELFGFSCACAKCSLRDAELKRSDERLAAIGSVSECVHELVQAGPDGSYLRNVHKTAPAIFLERMDARWFILRDEFPPDGRADGVECFLQAFVELCERAAAKLRRLAAEAAKQGGVSAKGSSDALQDRALAYMEAARDWADLSRDLTRDLKGEDSPAYQLWAKALDIDGVWDEGGSLDFYQRWVDAGLGRHPYCHRELA